MSKFKVNDEVRMANMNPEWAHDHNYNGCVENGMTGVVYEISDFGVGIYHVRFNGENCSWCSEKELELVTPKQMTKLLNYIGLAHLINGGKQPNYVNLILNTYNKEKVKYAWDESGECYAIFDKSQEDENYNFYLRDCLLDNQNFERCIEVVEEEPTVKEMTHEEVEKALGYKFKLKDKKLVKVIDDGETYSSYSDWLDKNYSQYKANWDCNGKDYLPKTKKDYELIGKAKHGGCANPNKILCLIQDMETKQVYIIGEDGVKVVGDR